MHLGRDEAAVKKFRDTVGTFPSGVTVTTVGQSEHPESWYGLTISSFFSLSLRPPMVVISLRNESALLRKIAPGQTLGISVLAANQGHLAMQFAKEGIDRFVGVDIATEQEVPLLAGAAAWFVGTVAQLVPAGDHHLVTINVVSCESNPQRDPLLYVRGQMLQA